MKYKKEDLKYNSSLLLCEKKESCNICGEATEFIDYCYEVRCCSDECLKELDNQYEKDYERMDKDLYNNDIENNKVNNMNKVYAVWIYNDEDSCVLDVFSTKEKADFYMKKNWYDRPKKEKWSPTFGIEEYEVK